MYTEAKLTPLVDRLYDTMLDADAWPRALIAVADALGGRLPVLFTHDSHTHAGGLFLSPNCDPAAVVAYNDYYQTRNVWLPRAERVMGTERLRTSHMMCPRRELLRSEFFAGWLKPMGVTQAMGATLLISGSRTSNFTFFAGSERADFDDDDRRFLGALVPHLSRALRVRERLEESNGRERALHETLERLSAGVLLVGARGRVLFMNAAARSFVGPGEGLVVDAEGLHAARADDSARLRALLGAACQTSIRRGLHSSGVLRVARPNGKTALEVLVSPLRPAGDWPVRKRAIAAVFVTDPALAAAAPEVLAHLYGLTAAEARVLSVIATGQSGKQAAAQLGISYNTLKTHLKHLFMKTDSRSQGELVRLVYAGVARLRIFADR